VIAIAAFLAAPSCLDGPIVLYPASPSLPTGPYLRTFEAVETGRIVAFKIPDEARRYQAERGHDVPKGFLFMKPVAAGPGDQVCNALAGLFINGKRIADTASHDREGRPLPVWGHCRRLERDEYFMISTHIPHSFDSRYFGPVEGEDIAAVYRPLF
jgi:conjugative transfer signal peptidase TraF